MWTFSAILAIWAGNSTVTGEFPTQRPVTRSFDVFFHLRLNKRPNKQSWGWWFETLSRPLWRHGNGIRILFLSLTTIGPSKYPSYMQLTRNRTQGIFMKYISWKHFENWDEIIYPFPNFSEASADVWKWMNNFIPHFIGHVITYPCRDKGSSMLAKWAQMCSRFEVNPDSVSFRVPGPFAKRGILMMPKHTHPYSKRYNDVVTSAMASQNTGASIVTQPFVQAQIKENIKAQRHWPLCGEFTGHRWIPRAKGQ